MEAAATAEDEAVAGVMGEEAAVVAATAAEAVAATVAEAGVEVTAAAEAADATDTRPLKRQHEAANNSLRNFSFFVPSTITSLTFVECEDLRGLGSHWSDFEIVRISSRSFFGNLFAWTV
jgi:hypothetical protein